MADYQTI